MAKNPAPVLDKSDASWHLDRKIPVALIVTLCVAFVGQTTTAAWFASKLDERVSVLERTTALSNPVISQQGERLTRVEEKLNAVQSTVQTGITDIKALLQQLQTDQKRG